MPLLRPPGPPSRGIVGNFPMASADPLALLEQWRSQYGDLVYYRAFSRHVYFVTHPDLIREVLLTSHRNFIKGEALRNNRRIFGNGLLTSEGQTWLQQRRLIQPAFHRDKIAACADAMVAQTADQMAEWRHGEERDLYREMMQLALKVVCKALFRIEIPPERDRFAAALDTVLELSAGGRMLLPPLLRLLPTPGNMRYLRSVRVLDKIVYSLIAERRREGSEGGDLLSELLQATDAEGRPLSETQVRDEIMTLLLAGHETTAVTLTWTWFLLARNPAVEHALADELRSVLAGRVPGMDDLPRLPYTARVVKEAIRLYPPIWALVRSAIHDCDLGGYRVPAGSTVLLSQWVTHRDPRFFADPERFDPDRWLREPAHRFAYFPFGGGPRSCIGASFATMEATLILATVAQQFSFRISEGFTPQRVPTITLRPGRGMRMRLERR